MAMANLAFPGTCFIIHMAIELAQFWFGVKVDYCSHLHLFFLDPISLKNEPSSKTSCRRPNSEPA